MERLQHQPDLLHRRISIKLRQAILVRAEGPDLPSKYDLVEYFARKGIDIRTSVLDLNEPQQVVQVCGAIVKFASGQWNGTPRIGELELGPENGEKHEYSSIREWWKNEGSKSARKMLSQMWDPNKKREESGPKT